MKCLFLTPNSKMVGAKTPKTNTKIPFVVKNLVIQFHKDQQTDIQVITRRPSVYGH